MENYRYEIVREDRYEEALKHMAEHSFPDEPCCKSVGLTLTTETREVMIEVLQQNMSISLISSLTEEIIGLRVIHIAKREDKFDPSKYQSEALRKMLLLLEYKNSRFNAFNHYDVNETFAFFGLSIDRNHRQKGLGLKLMQAAIVFLTNLKTEPFVVKGDCSSNFSKRIYEKLEFETLGEIKFVDYKEDGKIVITDTGEHTSLKVYGKIL